MEGFKPDAAGKYDAQATVARESCEAEGVLLIVINGNKGTGFTVQTTSPEIIASLPQTLRSVADAISVQI